MEAKKTKKRATVYLRSKEKEEEEKLAFSGVVRRSPKTRLLGDDFLKMREAVGSSRFSWVEFGAFPSFQT